MCADLLFWDPGDDVNPAIADLIELGFDDFEEVMEFDDCGPTVFLTAPDHAWATLSFCLDHGSGRAAGP